LNQTTCKIIDAAPETQKIAGTSLPAQAFVRSSFDKFMADRISPDGGARRRARTLGKIGGGENVPSLTFGAGPAATLSDKASPGAAAAAPLGRGRPF
jgi:hypothetical protein